MTDNRTTELLRALLDERGVKWYETVNHVNCMFTWWESSTFGTVHAMDNEDGKTLFMDCLNNCDFTPEQAITATLGSEREKALEELVRDMWREMLTCPDYATSPCMTNSICERVRNLEIEV